MERIIGSAGTVNLREFNQSYKKVQDYKERHAKRMSVDMAGKLLEKSARLKDSLQASFMLPSVDKEKFSESSYYSPLPIKQNNRTVMN